MEMSTSPFAIVGLILVIFVTVFFIVLIKSNVLKRENNYIEESTDYVKRKSIKKIAGIILLFIEGLPLIVYPFVFLASIMSLAGERTGNESTILMTCVYSALFFSISYPVTYILSFILFFKKGAQKVFIALMPALHLVVTIFLFCIWRYIQ